MQQTTFIAVYLGRNVVDSRLIAVSADPRLVADVSARLLDRPPDAPPDPVVASLQRGRRGALSLIHKEATSAPRG